MQLTTPPRPLPTPQTIRLRQTADYGGQAVALAPASPPEGRGEPYRTVILHRPAGGEAGPAFPRLWEGRVRGSLIFQLNRSG